MKIAYFDLIAGASGDMLLGALVDAGLPLDELRQALAALPIGGFELTSSRVTRGAFTATKVDVRTDDRATERHLAELEAVVAESGLAPAVQARSLSIFRRMTEAEAAIHGLPVERVHLHELGALDTIVDVTGVLLGLELLGVESVAASPVPLGHGTLHAAHGLMPLPAPATVALLRGAPVVGVDTPYETVTPTAAALLTELATSFGPIPAMRLDAVGYGAGTRTSPEPNILRAFIGEAASADGSGAEPLDVLDTTIDDMNPELYGYLFERLFAAGALDAHLAPVIMKKNRPGVVVSVLCRPADTAALRAVLFAETTTLGIRTQRIVRHALPRTVQSVETAYGTVRVKVAEWGGTGRKIAPEYEDCRLAAQRHGVPLRLVYEAAVAAGKNG